MGKKKTQKVVKKSFNKTVIGWREWAGFPDLGLDAIKAKVDTGARTTALHVSQASYERIGRKEFISFVVHPNQKSSHPAIQVRAPLLEYRSVKSSVGTLTIRPVIEVNLKLGDTVVPIEMTLVNRDMMGFRMLIGRQALKYHFLVDPHRSFVLGQPKKRKP